jgi:hypothetical protein
MRLIALLEGLKQLLEDFQGLMALAVFLFLVINGPPIKTFSPISGTPLLAPLS